MMSPNAPLVLCLCLLLRTATAGTNNSDPLALPQGGAPWHHDKTGISLPQRLGALEMENVVAYKDPALGAGLRFSGPEKRIRADVFVYPCQTPHSTDKEMKQAAGDELAAVLRGLKQLEAKGDYRNLKLDDGYEKEMVLGDDSRTFFFSAPARYDIFEGDAQSGSSTAVRSVAGVLAYRGHFIKMRFTSPEAIERESATVREAFTAAMLRCVFDASSRETIARYIADYRKEPLNEKGRDVAGGVTAFAEKSPLVNLVVSDVVVGFGEKCSPMGSDAALDVLRAFIVGATDAALRDSTHDGMVDAAITEVRSLCERWNKQDATFNPPSLDEFGAAVRKENEKNRPGGK